jgi:hypothetical protein
LKVSILQPTYLPWPGYFALIKSSDLIVFLDDVQFEKQSWQSRNRIINNQREYLLSLPVRSNFGLSQKINQMKLINPIETRLKHLETIRHSYARSPNFSVIFPLLEEAYNKNHDYLVQLNLDIICLFLNYLEISTDIRISSKLNVDGKRSYRLLNILNFVGSKNYLSPIGSRAYIENDGVLANNGIEVLYNDFIEFPYPQLSKTFHPNMSIVDMLFNMPKAAVIKRLSEGVKLVR